MPKVPTDNPDKDGRPRKDSVDGTPVVTARQGRIWAFGHTAIHGSRRQFTVKKPNDEQEYAWTVNIKSPLYRDLLGFLPKSPIMLRVIRTGEGRTDTRYTVKAA